MRIKKYKYTRTGPHGAMCGAVDKGSGFLSSSHISTLSATFSPITISSHPFRKRGIRDIMFVYSIMDFPSQQCSSRWDIGGQVFKSTQSCRGACNWHSNKPGLGLLHILNQKNVTKRRRAERKYTMVPEAAKEKGFESFIIWVY